MAEIKKKYRVVGDSETDGLLLQFSKCHVMAFCDYTVPEEEVENHIWVFTDEPILGVPETKFIKGGLREGVEFMLHNCDEVWIHNFFGYDYWVFNEIAPDLFNINTVKPWDDKWGDSLVQSRVQWYDRPTPRGYRGTHGLAAWGARCGIRKPEIEEWGVWNAKILNRVVEDIKINRRAKRQLNIEYNKLKRCGVDTWETYKRTKQAQFWLTVQEINGWKLDQDKCREYVKQLDIETTKIAEEVEPHLPKVIKNRGTQTVEDFAKEWNEYVELSMDESYKRITKWPKTKYVERQRNGETKLYPVKPLAKHVANPFTQTEKVTYQLVHQITGEVHKKITDKLAEARALCNELNEKLNEGVTKKSQKVVYWKPVKKTVMMLLLKNNVVNHFELDSNMVTEDTVIAAPYTPIIFEDAKMSQTAQVHKYLFTVGWKPTEYNYKKDADGKPMKVCRFKDTKRFLHPNKDNRKRLEELGLQKFEHKGKTYYVYDWGLKRTLPEVEGSLLRTSPKLTESSYDSIEGEIGQKIARYNTLMHRRRTMENAKDDEKGWLNMVREDGRMSAGATVFGTSTGRMTQRGIVNVPSGAAVFGEPMREVWIAEQGCSVVSTDMNSAQLVLLANFMGDEEFTKAVKEGKEEVQFSRQEDGSYYCKDLDKYLDPKVDKYLDYDEANDVYIVYTGTDAHTMNSIYFGLNEEEDILECRVTQDSELHHKISGGRKKAKNGIYALLFGAGDDKFALTIKMKSKEEGAMVKQTYFTKLPKIKRLIDRLEEDFKMYKKALEEEFGKSHPISKGGFVHVAGAYVWVKSPHKLLNYLLMGSEAQVQNEAVNLLCRRLLEEGHMVLNGRKPCTGARLLACIHDEASMESPNDIIGAVKDAMSWHYGEASKNLGLKTKTLVTGEAKAGESWLAVH